MPHFLMTPIYERKPFLYKALPLSVAIGWTEPRAQSVSFVQRYQGVVIYSMAFLIQVWYDVIIITSCGASFLRESACSLVIL